MRRVAPLTRRTPLTARTPLSRARLNTEPRTPPVPSPRRAQRSTGPTGAEREARRIVYARSGGLCELCGHRAESWSHRRASGQGGEWAASNGLHLCGDGVRGCHGWLEAHPLWADAGGWRLVHRDPDPAVTPVWLPGGWVLLADDGGKSSVRGLPAPACYPWRSL